MVSLKGLESNLLERLELLCLQLLRFLGKYYLDWNSRINTVCLQKQAQPKGIDFPSLLIEVNFQYKLALLAFKAAIVEDPFGALNTWNHTTDHCRWHGVTCGWLHCRVMGLDLQDLKLLGSISPNIGNLSFLRVLMLNNNRFHHEIPQQVSHLHSLRILGLSFNTLEGEIPRNLSGCARLTWRLLGSNQLVGEIPVELGSLMELQYLALTENHLTGTIPSSIGNMSSFEILGLKRNELGGKIPQALGELTKLKVISLMENRLSGTIPPSIFNLSSMIEFDISMNQIGGNLPANIGFAFPNIKIFTIFSNQFSGAIPRSISNATTSRWLQVGWNKLSGKMLPLDRLNNLQLLSIDSNYLGSGGYSDSTFFCSLTNNTTLRLLTIQNNSFGGTMPKCIGNFSVTLSDLQLGENLLFGTIPRIVGNLINLEGLFLDRNRFSGTLPSVLGNLHNLLSGAIPSSLGNLVNLTRLYLDHNNFHGYIPSHLLECRSLVVLDLSSNNLNGTIPPEFIGLSSLCILLNLSQNHLTCVLPKEVGKLNLLLNWTSLETSYTALHFLEILNLSYNNFEGTLPTKGIFNNVSATFVSGNDKLCTCMPEFHLPKCSSRNLGQKLILKWKFTISIFFGVLGIALVLALMYIGWLKKKRRTKLFSSSKDDSSLNLSYGILLKAINRFSSSNLIGVGIITVCLGTDYRGNEFKALVYEFIVNVSLEDWLHPSPSSANGDGNAQKLSLVQRINISINVASPLDYLHNHLQSPVLHCDLKPGNVLLDAEMVGHVGDFGLAKVLIESTDDAKVKMSSAGVRGTVGYAAPEGDVYSYGILLLEMFAGMSPTNEMFRENFNLHKFVKEALPEQLLEITDPLLLQEMDNHMGTGRGDAAHECLEMVYRIGVACSVEACKEWMNIAKVFAQLNLIRDKLHAAGLQG
ncbi:hypothetical protein BT93_E1630 [Corymbia citriodora subsp. variegata]|nr:hypothetical protein BT93_E1630 [Corymbia citriodora subsp. variegata]